MANEDQSGRLKSALAEALRLVRFAYSVPSGLWHSDDHQIAQQIADLVISDAWVLDIGDTQMRLVGATEESLRSMLKTSVVGLIDSAHISVRPMTAEEREAELEGDDEPGPFLDGTGPR